MSRLSRNELSIFLYPERVALLRIERRLTLRGYARTVRARTIVQCESRGAGERVWRAALDTLGAQLPAFVSRNMHVSVVLSDKFMHYTLIPWFDNLSDEEDLVMAQHRFREMCGDAADAFSVRVSQGPAGAPSLAAAVDKDLLQELSSLMGQMKIRIASVQPHLMVAYNSCRATLEGRSTWIALMEPNCLCLGALQDGRFAWIRKLRIGDAWMEEFPDILERESCLADTDVHMDEVMLWAPHLAEEELPTAGRWRIRRLVPEPASGQALPAAVLGFALETGA